MFNHLKIILVSFSIFQFFCGQVGNAGINENQAADDENEPSRKRPKLTKTQALNTKIGPVCLYKAKEVTLKKRSFLCEGDEWKTTNDLEKKMDGERLGDTNISKSKVSLYSRKRTRSLTSHMEVAAAIADENFEESSTGEILQSVYAVTTKNPGQDQSYKSPKNKYIMAFAASRDLNREAFVSNFGRAFAAKAGSKELKSYKCRDVSKKRPSTFTRTYDKPQATNTVILEIADTDLRNFSTTIARPDPGIGGRNKVTVKVHKEYLEFGCPCPPSLFPTLCRSVDAVLEKEGPDESPWAFTLGEVEDGEDLDNYLLDILVSAPSDQSYSFTTSFDKGEFYEEGKQFRLYNDLRKEAITDFCSVETFFSTVEDDLLGKIKSLKSNSEKYKSGDLQNLMLYEKEGRTRPSKKEFYKYLSARINKREGQDIVGYILDKGSWKRLPEIVDPKFFDSLVPANSIMSSADLGLTFVEGQNEGDFNFNNGLKPGMMFADRLLVPYNGSNFSSEKSVLFEAFDIIDLDHKRLIAVKPLNKLGDVAYVCSQAYIAAKAFLDPACRERTRNLLMVAEVIRNKDNLGDKQSENFHAENGAFSKVKTCINEFYTHIRTTNSVPNQANLRTFLSKRLHSTSGDYKIPVDVSRKLNLIDTFFEKFDEGEMEVVVAGLGNKKITSKGWKLCLARDLKMINDFGYKVRVGLISK